MFASTTDSEWTFICADEWHVSQIVSGWLGIAVAEDINLNGLVALPCRPLLWQFSHARLAAALPVYGNAVVLPCPDVVYSVVLIMACVELP